MFQGKALPIAEIKYNNAIKRSVDLRPKRLAGYCIVAAPKIVPTNALETAIPNCASSRLNTCCRESVTPEITAVSKPNNRPPREAVIALRKTREFFVVADITYPFPSQDGRREHDNSTTLSLEINNRTQNKNRRPLTRSRLFETKNS